MSDLKEWIQKDGEECRPCLLAALVPWYVGRLNDIGEKESADTLKEIVSELGPEEAAEAMDDIREQACASEDAETCAYLQEMNAMMMQTEGDQADATP